MELLNISIKKLVPHEETDEKNLEKVKKAIKRAGFVMEPIIVERKNFIILDGHHRTKILKEWGHREIPVLLVDYFDENILVFPRKKGIMVSKEVITKNALNNQLFPFKTSRHVILDKPDNIYFKLPHGEKL
ncbi:ParB N-terminal domain-containing protein [Candidatus Peregrinibacteria bacterium]|jgi:L-serine kinase (ADP)|nr:ParB N-terminal domain-containing protein [Candidatus Peregrinibacteria bacterium]MBT4147964.1 ParB N-terminal domain-containing protein [Candidatus Peregrinibacteria bacterium]MBT4366129.1 ParB N-terminal domain-containing protein [Candidatus Peregrinibacteria bacterium]MBT4456213.1 ParB N-terminal domain-containing protein [Candidatus Peregrinibacteria bacterium]